MLYFVSDVNPQTKSFTIRGKGETKKVTYYLVVNGDRIGEYSDADMTALMEKHDGWMSATEFLQCCSGDDEAYEMTSLEVNGFANLSRAIQRMELLFHAYEVMANHPKVKEFHHCQMTLTSHSIGDGTGGTINFTAQTLALAV